MDRKLFKEKFENSVDCRKRIAYWKDVCKRAIMGSCTVKLPRGHNNLIIVQEELAELQKEISKTLRGKGDRLGLIEELADVQASIYFIQNICGIKEAELNRAITIKIDRMKSTLDSEGEFR